MMERAGPERKVEAETWMGLTLGRPHMTVHEELRKGNSGRRAGAVKLRIKIAVQTGVLQPRTVVGATPLQKYFFGSMAGVTVCYCQSQYARCKKYFCRGLINTHKGKANRLSHFFEVFSRNTILYVGQSNARASHSSLKYRAPYGYLQFREPTKVRRRGHDPA